MDGSKKTGRKGGRKSGKKGAGNHECDEEEDDEVSLRTSELGASSAVAIRGSTIVSAVVALGYVLV